MRSGCSTSVGELDRREFRRKPAPSSEGFASSSCSRGSQGDRVSEYTPLEWVTKKVSGVWASEVKVAYDTSLSSEELDAKLMVSIIVRIGI